MRFTSSAKTNSHEHGSANFCSCHLSTLAIIHVIRRTPGGSDTLFARIKGERSLCWFQFFVSVVAYQPPTSPPSPTTNVRLTQATRVIVVVVVVVFGFLAVSLKLSSSKGLETSVGRAFELVEQANSMGCLVGSELNEGQKNPIHLFCFALHTQASYYSNGRPRARAPIRKKKCCSFRSPDGADAS